MTNTNKMQLLLEIVADNVSVHGHNFAARQLRKKGYTFRSAYYLIFRRNPRA